MLFRQLFDRESCTYTYLIADESTRRAVLIDPVFELVDRDLQVLEELGLTLAATVDTHVHADHVTAAWSLRDKTGCQIVYPASGSARNPDRALADGEVFEVDGIALECRHTPGHTSGSACYVLEDAGMVFTGDTLLIRGCGRTDFQEGSPETLYASVHEKLFSLPEDTIVYPGHDYKGRTMSTIGEEKAHNPRLGGNRPLEAFVDIMNHLNLAYPKKIDHAVPLNQLLGQPGDPLDLLPMGPAGVPDATADWLREHKAAVRLIDVRMPDEWNGPLGHIEGAELVPLPQLGSAAAQWDKDEPLLFICRSGGRSTNAARALMDHGFKRVVNLKGGMMAWRGSAAGPSSCG